jgi:hypothetical protein
MKTNTSLFVEATQDCYSKLTPGKNYEVITTDYKSFSIENDKGMVIHCLYEKCPYLNFGNWIKNEVEDVDLVALPKESEEAAAVLLGPSGILNRPIAVKKDNDND